ncbi:MAG: alginate export family protein [Bacteroidota bacterium]
MTQIKSILIAVFLLLNMSSVLAQLNFSLEVRPRSEYRHGFKALANEGQEAAFFIDQRTRFNTMFTEDAIDLKISLQDVRVWGNQPQLVIGDGNLTSVHEAWAKVKFADKLAIKVGRQEIAYDDERIFGAVGWAQQARSHDAALLMYQDSSFKAHLGLAFNQNSARLISTLYTINNYKAMQYLWLHKDWNNAKFSLLFLNNGRQVLDGQGNAVGTNFSQTLGGKFDLKGSKIGVNTAFYYQTGQQANLQATEISAYYANLDLNLFLAKGHKLTFGGEILSGNNQATGDLETNRAFSPFYGTNHKFNGLMDYFYVGNHANSVGLNDYYVKWGMKKKKFNTGLHLHLFNADGVMNDSSGEKLSSHLGTEVDFVFGFPVTKNVKVSGGYSQMFGTNSLVALRNTGSLDATSNWCWMMITINPSFKVSRIGY